MLKEEQCGFMICDYLFQKKRAELFSTLGSRILIDGEQLSRLGWGWVGVSFGFICGRLI